MIGRRGAHAACAALVSLTFACGGSDCVRRHELSLSAPGGDVIAMLYSGGCEQVGLAPQIVLKGHDGPGEVILGAHASRRVERMSWTAPDRLEVTYRSSVVSGPVSRRVTLDDDTIEVVYRSIKLRRRDLSPDARPPGTPPDEAMLALSAPRPSREVTRSASIAAPVTGTPR